MKRVAFVGVMLAFASLSFAQYGASAGSQNPPAGQAAATPQQNAAQAAPAGKRPPQAKTQPEFEAYKTAAANTDPAAFQKAAEDFAAKFPDSELRILLFKTAMRNYQNANNGDKTMEMARKVLTVDPDDPESLTDLAEILTERTRDTDLDRDQRFDEARKSVDHALKSIDTDLPAGVPADKLDAYKGLLRSNAYSILGTLDFNKGNFTSAEANFRKSIDAYPQPDPVTMLRLSLSLDRQDKYPEALTYANKAVDLTQEGTPAGTLARSEKDRLMKLMQMTGGKPATPAASTAPPKK